MKTTDVIIFLTFHESKECLFDNIKNFKRYMPNSVIVVNNGLYEIKETLPELENEENVILVQRKAKFHAHNMIPIHIEMFKSIKNKLKSRYILTLASNQLFVKENFYDYMKNYPGGVYQNPLHKGHLEDAMSKSGILARHVNMIGMDHFVYYTNHDSMFFLYEDFMEMMDLFSEYDTDAIYEETIGLDEEFLYAAFLVKKYGAEALAKFENYSYWKFTDGWSAMKDLPVCLNENFYIIKRVHRVYDDPLRIAIREMGQY